MNNFIKKESPHYEINYFSGSLAEKEADKIIACQEKEYQKILEFLGVKNDNKIKYFLYPSNGEKGKLTGDGGNGHADREWYEVDDTTSYPCAGSFVGFLIKHYGKEKFLELYINTSREKATKTNLETIKNITGKALTELESEWIGSLKEVAS